jgi:polysaccharide pyruvyl transferase WcaK-like protein
LYVGTITETSGMSTTAEPDYSYHARGRHRRHPSQSTIRRIVVFGNYGNGNLGDEATLQGLLDLLRARVGEAEIIAFAMNPADTTNRHGISAEPATRLAARANPSGPNSLQAAAATSRRQRVKATLQQVPPLFRLARGGLRFLSALGRVVVDPLLEVRRFKTLRRADYLLIGGGGQLSEPVDIFASLPLQVLKMTLLAKLARAQVLILNVGVIPLERRSSRMLVRTALRLADYRSVRDESSRSLAERIGSTTPLDVVPDLAYALDRPVAAAAGSSTRTVAINVFPHFDGRYLPTAGTRYRTYLDTMSSLTLSLLSRGYTVVLVPTQLRADPPAVADLRARLARAPEWATLEAGLHEAKVSTVDDLLEVLLSSDFVVGTRYHVVVLAFALGRPVLALASHAKVVQEMIEMGQESFLFDTDRADAAALLAGFERLEAARDASEADVKLRVSAKRARLAEEFDHLFGPNVPEIGQTASGAGAARDA